jgi:hypothetical protein
MDATLIEPGRAAELSVPDPAASLRIVRVLLFVWTLLIACPIRYWPIDGTYDNTWMFALNYGAAHGLAMGRDLIWTNGPLGYLAFPMDIGGNLARALAFQYAAWAVLAAIFADLFFRAGLSVRNLAYFAVFLSLSAPLYWSNFMGPENLLLAAALVLLIVQRQRTGAGLTGCGRYIAALVLAGVIPLIKLTGGLLIGGAVAGFLIESAWRRRGKIWRDVLLAAVIPLGVAAAACALHLPSLAAFIQYVRGSIDIAAGYSSAMSLTGDAVEFAGVAEVLIGFGAFLFLRTKETRPAAWFLLALLGAPLLISIKHGFVRQDFHVLNFFGFVGLALALAALILPLAGQRSMVAFLVLLNFGIVSLEYISTHMVFRQAMAESSGLRGAALAIRALHFATMRTSLQARAYYSEEAHVEPEIRAVIADSPVASLSRTYNGALREGLNLQLYPVVQRYSAYTPYLDERNAAWIRDHGPRYVLFDGLTIDHRQPWAETPAMWLEVYRWYDTRLLGKRSLLLERRQAPRFQRMVSTARFRAHLPEGLEIPASETPVFWTLHCPPSGQGSLETLLLRVPEVRMSADGGMAWRIIPAVLTSPVMGNFLPANLADFAALMNPSAPHTSRVRRLSFDGPGLSAYATTCQGEFLMPLP